MEEPSNEDAAAVIMEVKDNSTPNSQRKNRRRKLVQSTLFPPKPQVNETNTSLSQETHESQEGNGVCSSPNGKRKRKGKGGGSTKKATPKKKASDSGKEAAAAGIAEDGSSPLATGKKGNRRAKEKLQGDASPCKVLTPSSSKGKCRRQLMTSCPSDAAEGQTEHVDVPVIDLRLEAKLAAEENAKLFAGKQTHPFFSSRKLDKRSQETMLTTEPESKSCVVLPDDLHPPIHVFEKLQAQESVLLDWRNWLFCDEALISSNCAPENANPSVFEGSVEPLSFNDFLMISNSVETSPVKNDMSLNRCCNQAQMDSTPSINSSTSAGSKAQEPDEVDLSVECTDSINNSFAEHRDGFSQERMTSYNICSGSQPDSSLWATKYQPRKASEVCGNGDCVKFLNEWLQYWREKRPQTNKNSALGDKCISLDSDCSSDENYSDAESVDDEGLKNVLLVTGPVGSGKSAAIYACAKEQGFEVIEVSASDWRNGAHVKQKFGEAMESHRFSKWPSEDSAGSQKKNILSFSSVQNGNSSAKLNTDVVEVISETCPQEPEIVDVERENLGICNRVTNKTLILFEDVDTIFDEDRGFISTIQQLAETAKRPMILTCNTQDPVLPYQLDRLEVRFEVPSSDELLACLHKICMAENAGIPTLLLERFLGCCQGDIRKTIMLLQFWCQGIRIKKEREPQMSHLLQVDLDAWHWVLPKVIPWGFPCQLSEQVDEEITKFTSSRQSTSLLEIVEEEELSHEKMQDAYEIGYYNETDSIVAKKQAMLCMNGSWHEANGFSTQFNGVAEFSNLSGSPVAFARCNAKKRQGTVFSSLSGDECTENIPTASLKMPNHPGKEMSEGDIYQNLADIIPVQTSVDECTSQHHYFNREVAELNLFRYSETESQQMCDTFESADVSCVPESSYVPETEINGVGFQSNTVCCGEASVSFGAVCMSGAKSFPCLSMDANNLEEVIPDADKNSDTILRTVNDTNAEAAHEDEKTGDTHIEHGESPIRGYQGMDECSRADFNKTSIFFEEDRCPGEINPVEEAWKKLRHCREDLKSHVTSEMKEASQFQALVSVMADLISEADLMFGCYQPLPSDFIEMPTVPNVEPDTVYWSDKQLEMTSTIVQHGLGYLAKESAKTGPNFGLKKAVDLAWEMFACTTNTTELGKVLTQDLTPSQVSCVGRGLENGPPRNIISSNSEVEEHLNNTIQGLVPSRLLLALRGAAFSDYVSSLSQISKLEASRLLDNFDKPKNRRRGRVARHYLSAGQLMLSPEDVSLLAQQNCYGKVLGE